MAKFVYFRNATDDAYLNSVENFRGMNQSAGDTVEVFFTSATDSTGNTGFDKITITTTSNKEKEAMLGIAAAIAGSSSESTITVADDALGVYSDVHISVVAGITRNAVSNNGFTAITGDTTLTGADTGKIIQINPAATSLIQLPGAGDVGAGWNVRIVLTEDDGGAMDQIVNIGTKAGEFFNGILIGGDAGGSVVANGTSNDFINCKATATSGEEFFIFSDGTRMHCTGLVVDVSDTLFADTAAS